MSESSDLRNQAMKCRRYAREEVDPLKTGRLNALADEYDARALRIEDRLEDIG